MVITMLPNSAAVKEVYLSPTTGLLHGAMKIEESSKDEKVLMECGTIETATILSVAGEIEKCPSLTFVDAPVSGGPYVQSFPSLLYLNLDEQLVFRRSRVMLRSLQPALQLLGQMQKCILTFFS